MDVLFGFVVGLTIFTLIFIPFKEAQDKRENLRGCRDGGGAWYDAPHPNILAVDDVQIYIYRDGVCIVEES